MKRPPRRRAFTIVELLVVVAVIAVLVAILFPALSGFRQRGAVVACATQMRELSLAQADYATENNGRMIDAGLSHGGTGNPDVAWINTLVPTLSSPEALKSPLDSSRHWSTELGGEGTPIPGTDGRLRRTSYGLNNYLTQYSPAKAGEGIRTLDIHVGNVTLYH